MNNFAAGDLLTVNFRHGAWMFSAEHEMPSQMGLLGDDECLVCLDSKKFSNILFPCSTFVLVMSRVGIHYINMSYLQIDAE